MSKTSRLITSSHHPCYELSKLTCRSQRSSREWAHCLKQLEALGGPFGTGKEVAITLHSLSKVPTFVRQRFPATDALENRFVQRSISTLAHEMNESSIAITALAVLRMPSLPPALLAEFGETLCGLNRSNRWSDPRNLAQVCYVIGVIPGLPIGARASALSGWVSSALSAFPANRFKVKDIVQILTGFSTYRVVNEEIFSLLEKSILNQIQYCDGLAIGAILNSFGRLKHVSSREVVGALLATAVQHADSINAQSLCGILRGTRTVQLAAPERTALQLLVDTSFGRLIGDIPVTILGQVLQDLSASGLSLDGTKSVLEGQIPNIIQSLERIDDYVVQRNAAISLISGCESFGVDVNDLVEKLVHVWTIDDSLKLDFSQINLIGIVLKYRHATFFDSIDRIERSVIGCAKVLVLSKLLQTLVESAHSQSDLVQSLVEKIVCRISDLSSELAPEELAQVGLNAWTVLGRIPAEIKVKLKQSSSDSELTKWITTAVARTVDLRNRVFVFGAPYTGVPTDDDFKLFPNPPIALPLHPHEPVDRILFEISAIDPQLLLSHNSIVWSTIQSDSPTIQEKTFAFNAMIEQGKECVIFVPLAAKPYREAVLDTMQFIANR